MESPNTMDPAAYAELLQRKLDREIKAREEAEQVLETKSLELFHAREFAERNLRMLKETLSIMRDGFAILGMDCEMVFWNAAVLNHLEITPKTDIKDQSLTDLIKACEPVQVRGEHGDIINGDEGILQTILDQGVVELTMRDGRILVIKSEPLSSMGRPINIRDISSRRQLEQQLMVANKQEALGTLAGGIAHEINTPTQYISDNLRFLQDGFEDVLGAFDAVSEKIESVPEHTEALAGISDQFDIEFLREEVPRAIQQALEGTSQIASIVNAVRLYSHPSGEKREPANIVDLISSATVISRNEWKYVATLEFEPPNDIPLVPVRSDGIKQVLLNLIVNSAQAIAESRDQNAAIADRIRVEVGADEREVSIVIEDTGPGVPEELIDRIFDPFFTTKAPGKGTGQGLAICQRIIVEEHQGTFEYHQSELGGAGFRIALPLA
ncbi:ATP-binding protein [Nisaea acidiphila]|uniref:histidine kinase n=1 Tax=Nisaea acidiphila TaxID=1862145 RepID=A0A9J7AS34_9PROT|nr:ATP-binding protein [Nisaea acidiphila]UUX50071.1 ATP-binding protein [Nisaea acidiphila]